jgi:hypothetical protein
MSLYRKKPVVIEAFQWDGTVASYDAINAWAGFERQSDGTVRDRIQDGIPAMPDFCAFLIVNTLEGPLRASPGDWIIRGIKGELYPCKPDIFAATYEPVSGSEGETNRGDGLPETK